MKNPFRPFTGDSLLVALGLTLVSYLVLPLIKECINPTEGTVKGKFYLDDENHKLFAANKGEVH